MQLVKYPSEQHNACRYQWNRRKDGCSGFRFAAILKVSDVVSRYL
ncbi:MAG: hypothetical protein PF689_08895 [Deltaproteobacteria bacterium]|nr:hypothetical protein [Deltaproteobacteria bacterium]